MGIGKFQHSKLMVGFLACTLLLSAGAAGRCENFSGILKSRLARGNAALPAAVSSSKCQTLYDDWRDKERNRTVPVKIYLPLGAASRQVAPMPVVIFSHGLGGSREAALYLGESLAEHGYVAVHLQHPGSDESLWKSSGARDVNAIRGELSKGANYSNLKLRIEDVKFVLDELARRNQSDSRLAGKLELGRIGLAGHSFGAGTTMALAGQNYGAGRFNMNFADARVKAALYLSPPVNLRGRKPEEVYGKIKIPGMLMTGTEDNSPIGDTTAQERLLPFSGIQAPNQYLVNFKDGDHGIFGGRRRKGKDEDGGFQTMISRLSIAFFDAYLKGDQQQLQWLKDDAAGYLGGRAVFEKKG